MPLMIQRRHLIASSAAASLAAHAPSLFAQAAPIKVLVGFPPGGGTDAIARLLADKLKDELNRPVVVENRAGAGGQIAAQGLKAAAPDGTTLFLSHDHSISILPLVTPNAGFTADDMQAVAGFATFVNAFAVSGSTPAKTMAEYIAWVRADSKRGGVGVPAPGSIPEFVVKLLAERYGLDMVAAPYRGSAPLIADMLGNQIPAGTGSVPDFIVQHQAGKLRVLAVLGKERQAVLPEVPTLAELGVAGFEEVPYYGLFAPKGTPAAALEATSAAVAKVIAQPAVREQFQKWGLAPQFMTANALGARVRDYTANWAVTIKTKNLAPAR
jgi:tripartite-type tricarboxylate transporter receptor subunit TctC